MKFYVAFKKIKNFICAEIYNDKIMLHLKINPSEVALKEGYLKEMPNSGHFAASHIQINIKNNEDFEKAKELIDKTYLEN